MKHSHKIFFILVMVLFLLSIPSRQGFASVTGFIARDGLDNYFEYPYEDLRPGLLFIQNN